MGTMDAEPCFVDTSILLAATDTGRVGHAESHSLLEKALSGQARLFTCGQILREYLVVATHRVDNNGLGISPKKSIENVQSFRSCLQLLDENYATSRCLETLILKHKLKGKRIHDANIASIMIENNLNQIFTLNPSDFKAFSEMDLRTP